MSLTSKGSSFFIKAMGVVALSLNTVLKVDAAESMALGPNEVHDQSANKIMNAKNLKKQEQIQNAIDDLSERLNIGADKIQTLSSAPVTWRSGAMGCPQAGINYTQALVPGVLIILAANGQHFRYHASRNGMPKFCPNERAEAPSSHSNEI